MPYFFEKILEFNDDFPYNLKRSENRRLFLFYFKMRKKDLCYFLKIAYQYKTGFCGLCAKGA